eukprot:929189_1
MLSKRCIGCLVIFAVLVWFGCHSKSGSKFVTDVHKYRKRLKSGDVNIPVSGSDRYALKTARVMHKMEILKDDQISKFKHYQAEAKSFAKAKYKNVKENIAKYKNAKDKNVNDKNDMFQQGTQTPVDCQSSDTVMYAQSSRTDMDNQSSGTDTNDQNIGTKSIFEDGAIKIDDRYEVQDEVSGNTKGQK